MQQFLKTGSTVVGAGGQYTVEQTESVSETSVLYCCVGPNDKPYHLRHYQLGCPSLGAPRSKLLALSATTGILPVVDFGEALGLPFDIISDAGSSLADTTIGLADLVRIVIPQIGYGLAVLHRAGLLVRAVTPASILYDPASKACRLASFDNLAVIENGATATGAECKGLPPEFCPPELDFMGWSIYSDFFAFGISLLKCVRGNSVFQGVSPQKAAEMMKKWALPGVDRHILSFSKYDTLDVEQKVLYLILGLTNPEPKQRWGYNELRCWWAGEAIPLVQSGQKVQYQMYHPFLVSNTRCWDYPQLAQELAKSGNSATTLLPSLARHLVRQNPALGHQVEQILQNKALSPDGKLFYIVYTLAPSMSGLWWKGVCYNNTEVLARNARTEAGRSCLRQMLMDGCFSHLAKLRTTAGSANSPKLADYQQLEAWEREVDGKGTCRFIMKMGGPSAQRFRVNNEEFSSYDDFINAYNNRGRQLARLSKTLWDDKLFQAWLWAKGLAPLGERLSSAVVDDDSAFYVLMRLGESACSPDVTRVCRQIFLRWGPHAPLTWLKEHLDLYEEESGGIIRRFRDARWSESFSLETLTGVAPSLLLEYQNFVRQTQKNPFERVSGIVSASQEPISPIRADAYFCCNWHDLDVTPAFLKAIGDPLPENALAGWADEKLEAVSQQIQAKDAAIRFTPGFSAGGSSTSLALSFQVLCAGLWILGICVYAISSLQDAAPPGFVLLLSLAALYFPAKGLLWCSNYSRCTKIRKTQAGKLNADVAELGERRKTAEKYHALIKSRTAGNLSTPLPKAAVFQTTAGITNIPVPPSTMGGRASFVSFCVSNIAMAILPLMESEAGITLVSASIFCLLGCLFFQPSFMRCSNAFGKTLLIQSLCLFLCAVFHRWMLLPALAILAARKIFFP